MSVLRNILALLLAAASPSLAAGDSVAADKASQLTEADQAAAVLAITRGRLLHDYDQAAWHTTDTMLEDIDPRESGVRGWVVTPQGDDLLVTYWKPDGGGYAGVYSALWTGTDVTARTVLEGDATRLSDEQLRLIQARQAVDPKGLAGCSTHPFNTVVLPDADGTILVYFLTPQTSLSSVPMGGHYRFTVKDGKVVDQRKFTNSCIELDLKGSGNGKPAALVISHLLDPVPTEIHVFSVYAAGIPIYVQTTSNEVMWVVEVSGGEPRFRIPSE